MDLWVWIVLGVLIFLAVSGIAAMLYITIPISKKVYFNQLVRTSDEKWGRVCSAPDNEEQLAMWNEGVLWGEENKYAAKEVSVKNGDLTLYGEYYDFGSDKCAVILPGRCESLMYSWYFAKPYKTAGMNILVIDTRCHGKSGGKYSSIGKYESEDLKIWLKHISSEFSVKSFWLHGICIGSAAALLAAAEFESPELIGGIVLEGCFVDFRESFKQHMIYEKRPVFPVLNLVMHNIKRYAGVDVMKIAPLKTVKKIECPILFLFGKLDVFSLPVKSQLLYDTCASKHKKLVWFDKGGHSHLRINNKEQYDSAVLEFVSQYEESLK